MSPGRLLSYFQEKYALLYGRFASARERFWIWLYLYARAKLPEGWHDDVWLAFLKKKVEDLREYGIPEEFVLFAAEDLELRILEQEYTREARLPVREVRDCFRRKQ